MASFNFSLRLVAGLLCLAGLSRQYCVLRSNCSESGMEGCFPFVVNQSNPKEYEPEKWDFPEDLQGICPEYEKVPNCCNQNTMIITKNNFVSLDLQFGQAAAGCSICAANMRRFYCKYNCDPNQHVYLLPNQSEYVNVTTNPDEGPKEAVFSNISLSAATACSLYESCKNVDFVKALGSMQSYTGFFSTLSSQGIDISRVIMNYLITPNGTLESPINNCSMVFEGSKDQYGYYLVDRSWCDCQHCAYNCSNSVDFSLYVKPRGVLDGLDFNTVEKAGLIAAIILILGLLLRFTLFNSSSNSKAEGENDDVEAGRPGYYASKA